MAKTLSEHSELHEGHVASTEKQAAFHARVDNLGVCLGDCAEKQGRCEFTLAEVARVSRVHEASDGQDAMMREEKHRLLRSCEKGVWGLQISKYGEHLL